MEELNYDLKKYIEEKIFPEYNKNEEGHGINHIKYVIRRSFELISQNNLNVNHNMVYVIAAYHDLGHHIDRKKHEKISADIMEKDNKLKEFFSNYELKTIKEAIEDHRASAENEPRSIYGKIVSSADRNNTVEQCLLRTFTYGKEHESHFTNEQLFERSYEHLVRKFGYNGYAKFFLNDREYEDFLNKIRKILEDKKSFCKIQEEYLKSINLI